MTVDGQLRRFWSYRARGVSPTSVDDHGTIALTAAGGSVAFATEICVPALKTMREPYGTALWREYGFVDSFNPTFRDTGNAAAGWSPKDHLGIDQGPIAIVIENVRTGLVWNTMKKNRYVIAGKQRTGFGGGWLDTLGVPNTMPR